MYILSYNLKFLCEHALHNFKVTFRKYNFLNFDFFNAKMQKKQKNLKQL